MAASRDSLTDPLDRLGGLIARAQALGADAADAVLFDSRSLSITWRLGVSEGIERAESRDLGLRVIVGQRQAIVSSTDLSDAALDELAERAVAMAKTVPDDLYCGLADPDRLAAEIPDLDLADDAEPAPAQLAGLAGACEDAARAVEGVTNSGGAEADWSRTEIALVGSNGFAGGYAASRGSVGVSVLAGEGTAMERDYDYAMARYLADLEDAAAVGSRAGRRAVARLKPQKMTTGKRAIVYDPRVANGLLRHFAGAISGAAIARGTSFLKDRLGSRVFAPGLSLREDPLRPRGLSSRPFDGEGVATSARELIADGVLTTWLLDSRSARQLGLKTTGHASRGTASAPSPGATNLTLEPGAQTPAALIGEIDDGFYVTELIGMGVNGVTGDYSRGASGLAIVKGELAHAVSEVTIAGNLKDMFAAITPANDLEIRYGTDAPTLRVDGMTVAGR